MPQRKCKKVELKKAAKRQERNRKVKGQVKSALKGFRKTLEKKDKEALRKSLNEVYKVLDRAAAKNVIHKNKASRKKGRCAELLHTIEAGAKPGKGKATSQDTSQ
ncbi:MAG: 30S ribosomal protein S20 [Candidatus Omnitrophica bacterium]|nr:30S ribosomal protein S20 [Candidatus Omnitrophota bacterium]